MSIQRIRLDGDDDIAELLGNNMDSSSNSMATDDDIDDDVLLRDDVTNLHGNQQNSDAVAMKKKSKIVCRFECLKRVFDYI